jgi:hypothetical protein
VTSAAIGTYPGRFNLSGQEMRHCEIGAANQRVHGCPCNPQQLRVFPPRMDPSLIAMTLLGLLFAGLAIWLYCANRNR